MRIMKKIHGITRARTERTVGAVNIKILGSLLMVTVLTISLSGCGDVNALFPLTPQQLAQQKAIAKHHQADKLKKACNNANVLLSDLSKPVSDPVYSLSPGVVCYG